MNGAQVLSLVGGIMQVVALGWAWFALYQSWRERWPDAALFPRVAAARASAMRVVRRVWHWLTLRPRRHAVSGNATLAAATSSALGAVTVSRPDSASLEERLDRVEVLFGLMEEHHADEMRALRATMDERFDALAEEHRAVRERTEHQEQRAVRFNLTGPALLAILGTIGQTWAALLA